MPNAMTITLNDETLGGERTHALSLHLFSSRITLRELLRRRIYEEVQEHNMAPAARPFRGFVTPTVQEQALGDQPSAPRKPVDWKAQLARACEAFEQNGFFVLVGDLQVETLDEELELRVETPISFVKIVPLVGG